MRQSRLVSESRTLAHISKNLIAGLTVAIVALPLALAFGIGSGLGAQSGLVTAIFAGVLAAVFGGSKLQVSGPTGAMTVILIPIVASFGTTAVLQVGLMASVFLLVAAALRLGRHIHRLPTSLIEGFTAGIAIVIALQQVAFVLGVKLIPNEHIWASVLEEVQLWWRAPQLDALVIGMSTIFLNIWGGKRWPKLPMALVSIVLATFATGLLSLELETIGALPANFVKVNAEFLSAGNWLVLLPSALAVAFLAGLESLLSAKIADRLSQNQQHQPNRELFGQGVANLVVPFLGGVPATAALARTAVNVRQGADSRLAAISHGIFLAIFVLALAPLISLIPLSALGGVLIATAYHMIRFDELRTTAAKSRLDGAVLVITLIATVLLDLISALAIGLIIYLVLRRSKLSKAKIEINAQETLGD